MTQKGYINDFYKQFEELNRKLDKANETISNLLLYELQKKLKFFVETSIKLCS